VCDDKDFDIHFLSLSIRYGFESSKYVLQGLKVRSYTSIVDQIKTMGFNTIRVSFSGQMLNRTTSPAAADVDYALNKDLVGLTPLQCLDALVSYCGRVGVRIILTRSSCYADGQFKPTIHIALNSDMSQTGSFWRRDMEVRRMHIW
jgi:aryl-phospho-beta-D-glucosidase BglC (GH1 family)